MPINFLKQIIQQENFFSADGGWIRKSPSKACEDYIEGFYLFYEIENESEQWIFNDGFPSIIFFPEKENCVCVNIGSESSLIKSGWIDVGVIKKVYVKYLEDLDYILVVRFKPEGFRQIFNFGFSNNIMALSDMDFSAEMFDKIFETSSLDEKTEIIELAITSLIPVNSKTGLLNSAVKLINDAKGQISVADVIGRINVNYKWLERNFSKYMGLTPKEYIQLQRFVSAYIGLHNKQDDLLSVALSNGYYDYNHFLKEFKDFTGKTPMEYMSDKRQ